VTVGRCRLDTLLTTPCGLVRTCGGNTHAIAGFNNTTSGDAVAVYLLTQHTATCYGERSTTDVYNAGCCYGFRADIAEQAWSGTLCMTGRAADLPDLLHSPHLLLINVRPRVGSVERPLLLDGEPCHPPGGPTTGPRYTGQYCGAARLTPVHATLLDVRHTPRTTHYASLPNDSC